MCHRLDGCRGLDWLHRCDNTNRVKRAAQAESKRAAQTERERRERTKGKGRAFGQQKQGRGEVLSFPCFWIFLLSLFFLFEGKLCASEGRRQAEKNGLCSPFRLRQQPQPNEITSCPRRREPQISRLSRFHQQRKRASGLERWRANGVARGYRR